MKKYKNVLKNIIRSFGYEVTRYNRSASSSAQIVLALKKFHIDLILDVGANEGQFASQMRHEGYKGRIVSFEPLSTAYKVLLEVSNNDRCWTISPRCALGSRQMIIDINISKNSQSSSLLPMHNSHLVAAPDSIYVDRESVEMDTLDNIASIYLQKSNNPFLKIDTQGYEWEVLDGAVSLLPRIKGVLLELSLVELYEGQRLWRDLIDRMDSLGFSLWAIHEGFGNQSEGRSLQLDAVFFRQ